MIDTGEQSGREAVEPAFATGLLELDDDGLVVRDALTRLDGTLLMPGQRVDVSRHDPKVAALVAADRLQFVADLPRVTDATWWQAPGRVLQCEPGDARPFASERTPGALKIVMGTGYDPGACAYRLHSAVNECTPHASAFVRLLTQNNNPHAAPTQYDLRTQLPLVRALLLDADVVHCHIDALLTRNAGLPARPRAGQIIVRHYHGTQFGANDAPVPDHQQVPVKLARDDDADGYVLVGARLQLCALRPGRMHWLPIPVPVTRYAAMAARPRPAGPFRIAHSPTRRRLKGTQAFLVACARLTRQGLPVEPVLIEHVTHTEALRIKATCHATFDAFHLGIQGSGLEAAAMGQPVIAGDGDVAALYRQHVGYVPYTYAGDGDGLEAVMERLVVDADFRADETRRVSAYVRAYHDYPAVAQRYERILREAA